MSFEGIGGVLKRRKEQARPKPAPLAPGQLPGIDVPEKKKERYLHSEAHVLADEISAYFNERKKFAAYLMVIRRIGVPQARTAFSSLKTGDVDAHNPRKFFMWLSKSNVEKPPAVKTEKKPGKKPKDKQLDMDDFLG